jgi:RNA polymerase sigma-70 factor (ECF subfamily)
MKHIKHDEQPLNKLSDEQLAKRYLVTRDDRCMNELVERHGEAMKRYVFPWGHDADDVTQDAWISVWKTLHQFDPDRGNSFRDWLSGVVCKRGKDATRKRKRRGQFTEIPKSREPHCYDPDLLEHAEEISLLHDVMAKLDEKDRRILQMGDLEDISDKEIAKALDLSVVAVRTRRHRVKEFLKESMGQAA